MENKIAVIGLGYVGLPLARLFATQYAVVGFDINKERIAELNAGTDTTLEVEEHLLKSVLLGENPFSFQAAPRDGKTASAVQASHPSTPQSLNPSATQSDEQAGDTESTLQQQSAAQSLTSQPLNPSSTQKTGLFCSADLADIRHADTYIVTVPTPVDKNHKPDLTPLYRASETVGKVLKKGDTVIYESTVYPGATEEECIPVLERVSGLKFNTDFFAGYSPERINPGDKQHTVEKILKVTSGSTPETAARVDALYRSVISAGTHLAPSIKVAEAAKVIENSQRDINIAFVNELAKIFNLLGINTHDVLEAAGTKWNFLPFKPGLVGGHCIGVDPYYLAQKAQQYGYHPEIILAGRRLNDSMGAYVASQVVKAMIRKNIGVNGARVLMLGITFKENCPDVRNTKIVDVVAALTDYGMQVDIYDPWADPAEVQREYGLTLTSTLASALTSASARQFECPPQADVSRTPSTSTSTSTSASASTRQFECPPQADVSRTPSISALASASPLTSNSTSASNYDAIILGVAHAEFLKLNLSLNLKTNGVIYDVKGILAEADARL